MQSRKGLEYASKDRAVKLDIASPPQGIHKNMHQQKHLDDVANFINTMQWQAQDIPETGHATTTWLELLIRFELRGYDWNNTAQAKRQELKQAVKDGCNSTERWKRHEEQKGRALKMKPKRNQTPHMVNEALEVFKKTARYL